MNFSWILYMNDTSNECYTYTALYENWISERIDDLIDEWHTSDGELTLAQHLRMTDGEFKNYLKGLTPQSTINYIIEVFGEFSVGEV